MTAWSFVPPSDPDRAPMGPPITMQWVDLHIEARYAAIEEACEKALQGGVCGVLIYRDAEGVEHVGPHYSVPYGMIHQYPQGLPPDLL